MSELITIARPYAKAAFENAQKKKKLADWASILQNFAVLVADKRANSFLSNPTVKREDKVALLEGFISDLDEDTKVEITNFLLLLAEYNRLTALPEIAQLYMIYRDEYEKSMEVEVTSARLLDSAQEMALTQALSKRLNRDVSLRVNVDDSLLGGVIIQAGDFVIDGSVRGKLAELAAQLTV